MDLLNGIGSVASIIGLVVTFYTLYKVSNLPAALKQHSRDEQLLNLIDNIIRLPPDKATLTSTTAREVEFLIRTIHLYYVSKISFKQRKLKSMLTTLEGELGGRKQLRAVQLRLGLIRDEITIR